MYLLCVNAMLLMACLVSQRQSAAFDRQAKRRLSFIPLACFGLRYLVHVCFERERALLCLMGEFAYSILPGVGVNMDDFPRSRFLGVVLGSSCCRAQTMVCDLFLQRRLDFGEAKSNFIILIIHVVVEFVISGLFFISALPN